MPRAWWKDDPDAAFFNRNEGKKTFCKRETNRPTLAIMRECRIVSSAIASLWGVFRPASCEKPLQRRPFIVMAGLCAGHPRLGARRKKTWMRGTSPRMTIVSGSMTPADPLRPPRVLRGCAEG
jgi:hypothetical protein